MGELETKRAAARQRAAQRNSNNQTTTTSSSSGKQIYVSDAEILRQTGASALDARTGGVFKTKTGIEARGLYSQEQLTQVRSAGRSEKIVLKQLGEAQREQAQFVFDQKRQGKEINVKDGVIIASESKQPQTTTSSKDFIFEGTKYDKLEKNIVAQQKRERTFEEQPFVKGYKEKAEVAASFITFGFGKPSEDRGLIGGGTQKAVEGLFNIPFIGKDIASGFEKIKLGYESKRVGGDPTIASKQAFNKLEQTSFSFLPGGTPINQEGVATIITAGTFALIPAINQAKSIGGGSNHVKINLETNIFKDIQRTQVKTGVVDKSFTRDGGAKTISVRSDLLVKSEGRNPSITSVSKGRVEIGRDVGKLSITKQGKNTYTYIDFGKKGTIYSKEVNGIIKTKLIDVNGKVISQGNIRSTNNILKLSKTAEKVIVDTNLNTKFLGGDKGFIKLESTKEFGGFETVKDGGVITNRAITLKSKTTTNQLDVASKGYTILKKGNDFVSIELIDPKIKYVDVLKQRKPNVVEFSYEGVKRDQLIPVRSVLKRPELVTTKEIKSNTKVLVKFEQSPISSKMFSSKKGQFQSSKLEKVGEVESLKPSVSLEASKFNTPLPENILNSVRGVSSSKNLIPISFYNIKSKTSLSNKNDINTINLPITEIKSQSKTKPINIMDPIPKTTQLQTPIQTPILDTPTPPTSNPTSFNNFYNPPTPTPIKIPEIPKIPGFGVPFNFPLPTGGGSRSGGGRRKKISRITQYAPSLVAVEFGIKGKNKGLGILSGLAVRPL